jgi:hypothetical protein
MTIEKRDVTFKSADNLCSGWLFLPQRANADKQKTKQQQNTQRLQLFLESSQFSLSLARLVVC